MNKIKRNLQVNLKEEKAILLLGPRKTGKTTFLKTCFPKARVFDLLKTDLRNELSLHPERIRQIILAEKPSLAILDEIQKVPELLDEIHWCIENTSTKFILCGSSARKLKSVSSGVLGGRAARYEFFPLTMDEVHDSNLTKIFNHGLIPQHYLASNPNRILKSYVVDYLEEEIRQEAIVKNLPAFSRFLETAALLNGELLNFENVGREAGVSPNTVKNYYDILVDTLFGFYLLPWERSQTRRLIETRKFFLFDCGVIRALKELRPIFLKTPECGKLFETFLINEIRAYQSYHEKFDPLFYWRTSTGLEVDLILGRSTWMAMEFKCTDKVQTKDLKGIRAFLEENQVKYPMVVYCGKENLKTEDGIRILPWQKFCEMLWACEFTP